jgi:hypothetical protein
MELSRSTTRDEWSRIYRAAREWAHGDWARVRPEHYEFAFYRFGVWGVYPPWYTAQDSFRDRRQLGK